jgi:hypothetical protein
MASSSEIMQALRNADAAGDNEGAARLAKMYTDAKAQESSSAKSNPLVDLATGFAAPFQKLGNDVVQNFQERRAQADRGPPTSLGQFAKESFGDIARTGGILADVGGLVTAPIQAGARAIAGQLSQVPIQAYSPGGFSIKDGKIQPNKQVPLSREQTKQQLEGDLMTAFSALAPESRVPIVRAPIPAAVAGTPQKDVLKAASYVQKLAGNTPIAQTQFTASPQILAEALGKRGQAGISALAKRGGETGDLLEGVISQRAEQRPTRIINEFETSTGLDPAAVKGDIEGIIDAGRKKADPLFKAARADKTPVVTDKLNSLLSRPVVKKALTSAVVDIQNAGGDPMASGFVVKGILDNGLPDVVGVNSPTVETWDKIYKAISSQVERHPLSQKPLPDTVSSGNYNINTARADLRKALGDAAPKWNEAMTAAGEYKPVETAFQSGGKFMFDNNVASSDFAGKFAKLSPAEQNAWKGGIANEIFKKAQTGKLNPSVFKTPILKEKLVAAFGQDGADKLLKMLSSEKGMQDFERRYGPGAGSITQEIRAAQAEQDAGNGVQQFALDALGNVMAHGGTRGALKTVGGMGDQILTRMKTAGMSEAAMNEAGRILAMTGPESAAHQQALAAALQYNKSIPKLRGRAGSSVLAEALKRQQGQEQ